MLLQQDNLIRSRRCIWLGILALVLMYAYGKAYMTYSADTAILQSSVSNLNLATILTEKQPIVFTESVVNAADSLSKTVFRYHAVLVSRTRVHAPKQADAWTKCLARWTLLVPRSVPGSMDATDVDVRHPSRPIDVVRIKLKPNQPLVLPPGWLFRLADSNPNSAARIDVTDMYDVLCLLLRPLATVLLRHREPSQKTLS